MISAAPANEAAEIKVHYNIPQLLFEIAKCRHNYCIWGRRTGKSEGPMVSFTLDNIFEMPRSNGFLIGTTYEQLLSRTLPPLIAGWERMGFIQNVHFWRGKFAPDHLNIPKAYRHPQRAEHYFHWCNGSGIYLVSQDRPGTINGVATQWGAGDEAKYLNRENLQEGALITLSGNADKFGDQYNYLSTLFCSDMPTNAKGRWLIDAKEKMDPEIIQMIIGIRTLLQQKESDLNSPDEMSVSSYEKLRAEVNSMKDYLNELRKLTTYYSTASTFDNVHALGMDTIRNLFRELDVLTFLTSVLNELVEMIENCFYSGLNSDHHGQYCVDYDFMDANVPDDTTGYIRDCRMDADRIRYAPLQIACDYNSAINSVVTGQEQDYRRERRLLSSLYVEHPMIMSDLIEKWCDYYAAHESREVTYVYDQTAIPDNADGGLNFAEKWIEGLTRRGWNVNAVYIGAASRHKSRYFAWNLVLSEKDKRLPLFRYNKEACKAWQVSCERAGIIQGSNDKRDFKKDKRSERDKNIPPHEATHLSEAGDCLFWYWFYDLLKEQPSFVEMTVR